MAPAGHATRYTHSAAARRMTQEGGVRTASSAVMPALKLPTHALPA